MWYRSYEKDVFLLCLHNQDESREHSYKSDHYTIILTAARVIKAEFMWIDREENSKTIGYHSERRLWNKKRVIHSSMQSCNEQTWMEESGV